MTCRYGSGSADLYLWLTDPDPTLVVSDLQDANNKVFLLITFWRSIYLLSKIKSHKDQLQERCVKNYSLYFDARISSTQNEKLEKQTSWTKYESVPIRYIFNAHWPLHRNMGEYQYPCYPVITFQVHILNRCFSEQKQLIITSFSRYSGPPHGGDRNITSAFKWGRT